MQPFTNHGDPRSLRRTPRKPRMSDDSWVVSAGAPGSPSGVVEEPPQNDIGRRLLLLGVVLVLLGLIVDMNALSASRSTRHIL